MNDQESYVAQGVRALQPFDFAGRTGTVEYSVDAKEEGSHSSWTEMWLTQDPIQTPHEDFPGTHIFPREGLQVIFDNDCPTGMGGLRQIVEYHNFIPTTHDFAYTSPCFTTQDDMANHFQIKVSQGHVQVWASNAGGGNFSLRSETNVNLPWSRGYLSFQHAQYDANKFNNMQQTTYHWHAIGFDGPVVPTDRDYQVPDALQPGPSWNPGSINLGYQTPTPTFTLQNVDPSNARQAWVTFNDYWFSSPLALNVTVNGHTHTFTDPDPQTPSQRYQWHYLAQQIPLSELVPGSNTVQVSNTGCGDQCPTIANVDLEVTR
jgi:hypothetical protein